MMEAEHEPSREFRDVVKGGHYEAPPATSKDKEEERFMLHESSAQGSTSKRMAAQSVTTPTSAQERRSVGEFFFITISLFVVEAPLF